MERYTTIEARQNLEKLLQDAQQGKTIVITGENRITVQLVPMKPSEISKEPRKPGSAEGQVWMSDDFDAPLDDFEDYMP